MVYQYLQVWSSLADATPSDVFLTDQFFLKMTMSGYFIENLHQLKAMLSEKCFQLGCMDSSYKDSSITILLTAKHSTMNLSMVNLIRITLGQDI